MRPLWVAYYRYFPLQCFFCQWRLGGFLLLSLNEFTFCVSCTQAEAGTSWTWSLVMEFLLALLQCGSRLRCVGTFIPYGSSWVLVPQVLIFIALLNDEHTFGWVSPSRGIHTSTLPGLWCGQYMAAWYIVDSGYAFPNSACCELVATDSQVHCVSSV